MVSKTLAQKLYIRPGYTVALLNAPKGVTDLLEPLPEEVTLVTKVSASKSKTSKAKASTAKAAKAKASKSEESEETDKLDHVLCFVKNEAELKKSVKELADALDETVVLWFAYPKLSSKSASDLTRDKGWQTIHDLGYDGIANVAIDEVWSAIRFKRRKAKSADDLIARQYAGERAALLPLYERLASVLSNLGPDVQVTPRQAYVAFARSRQFALLMPSRERLDLVLRLPNAPFNSRLIAATNLGSGSMTHRVPITSLEEIDMEVMRWIGDAYRGVNR